MVNNGRNVRMNRRQMESRRRKQLIKWILLIAKVVVLIILIICIRNIYSRLDPVSEGVSRCAGE